MESSNVDDQIVPYKGQKFADLDAAYMFYNNYARKIGFSTRKGKQTMDKEGNILWKAFFCFKEGLKGSRQGTRRVGIIREKCGARMLVVRDRSCDNYVVSKFVESHSHPLTTPRKVHLLRSHRKVNSVQRSLTESLSVANIRPSQQISLLALESGGLDNVGFVSNDLHNLRRDARNRYKDQDANMLKEYFECEVRKDSEFRFSIKSNEEGMMTHCFWSDSISRKSYSYFGDVVVFDTTYNTNRYSMILAPILGVNHHRQTILFGCAFLSDETSDSFEWLFKEFLLAMPSGPPKRIITDQDPAMTKAFSIVLPDTVHRYCIWHIVNKFSEKIGGVACNKSYMDFNDCIWNSETPEEFEQKWKGVLLKYNLTNNEWLNGLYVIRHRWIPAFTRAIFSAQMTSSQRVEGAHAFFKQNISADNTLWDFITRFDRAHDYIRHNVLELDHVDINKTPELKTPLKMEASFRDIYTRAIFFKCQTQIFESIRYTVHISAENELTRRYEVRNIQGNNSRVRVIEVDQATKVLTCSCKMLESDGIPCRHLLAYCHRMDIVDLPDQFVMHRWMKDAIANRTGIRVGSSVGGSTSTLLKRHGLIMTVGKLVDKSMQ